MRKISANYVFPVTSPPLKNGILILDDNNRITDVVDTKGKIREIQNLEFYSGVIVPGFVDLFTLLNFPSFTEKEFQECISSDFSAALKNKLQTLKADSSSIQRGINHLEAFGTVAIADYCLPDAEVVHKEKSKITFRDIDYSNPKIHLQLPGQHLKTSNAQPILVNRIVLENKTILKPSQKNMNNCCIGTGSLGTHKKLSVFDELKAIQSFFPEITFWELIKWGTINGAKHLQLEKQLGSIEIGKSPGLNLLTKLDYPNNKLTAESELTVLV